MKSYLSIILLLISKISVHISVAMLCNKDTAMDTGLDVWVDGDPDGSGPDVE